ncbi:MAG: biotin/lipoate A/B protein ligase family protein [Planctomycetota bacterium]
MAVDEAILDASLERPEIGPTLRWYTWIEPTLSLGYFQAYGERPSHVADLPVVRRITGGGAILHDRELTYSLIMPPGSWPHADHLRIVRDFHRLLTELLSSQKEVSMHPTSEAGAEPYLCFLRRAPGDIVASGHKVVGSAQRSRQGGLLQHGSILLETSDWTPEIPGMRDAGLTMTPEEITAGMAERLAQEWGFDFQQGQWSDKEQALAQHFHESKYANDAWTRQR